VAFITTQTAGNQYFAVVHLLRIYYGFFLIRKLSFVLFMCSPFQKLELKCTNEKQSGFTFSSYELQ
jgi:hypothetical protein